MESYLLNLYPKCSGSLPCEKHSCPSVNSRRRSSLRRGRRQGRNVGRARIGLFSRSLWLPFDGSLFDCLLGHLLAHVLTDPSFRRRGRFLLPFAGRPFPRAPLAFRVSRRGSRLSAFGNSRRSFNAKGARRSGGRFFRAVFAPGFNGRRLFSLLSISILQSTVIITLLISIYKKTTFSSSSELSEELEDDAEEAAALLLSDCSSSLPSPVTNLTSYVTISHD